MCSLMNLDTVDLWSGANYISTQVVSLFKFTMKMEHRIMHFSVKF